MELVMEWKGGRGHGLMERQGGRKEGWREGGWGRDMAG